MIQMRSLPLRSKHSLKSKVQDAIR
jgi:hypothetical protein